MKIPEEMPKNWPKYAIVGLTPPPPTDDLGWVLCGWFEKGIEYQRWMHESWLVKIYRTN